MWFLNNAWLIPVIPTVSFFLIILFGKRTARWTNGGSYIGLAALLASFVLAGTAVSGSPGAERPGRQKVRWRRSATRPAGR
jgi:hypothetical protein